MNAITLQAIQNDNYQQAVIFGEKALEFTKYWDPNYYCTCESLIDIFGENALKYLKYLDISNFFKSQLIEEIFGEEALKYTKYIDPNYIKSQSLDNLGKAYLFLKRYKDAEIQFKKSYEIRSARFGERYLDSICSMNNLCELYLIQKRFKDAEPFAEKAHKMCEYIMLENDHIEKIKAKQNLGVYYNSQKKYYLASLYLENAYKLKEKVLGDSHKDAIKSFDIFVQNEHDLQKLCANIKGKKAKIKYWKRIHKKTSDAIHNHKYHNGLKLAQLELKLAKKNFKDDDNRIIESTKNVGDIYYVLREYNKSEPYLYQVMQYRIKNLGKTNNDTIVSIHDMGMVYLNQKRYKKSESLLKKAMNLSKQYLGLKHLNTIVNISHLGILYKQQKKYKQAENLLKSAMSLSIKYLGYYKKETKNIVRYLGDLYFEQEHYEKANLQFKEAKKISTKIFGKNHPDTINSISKLGELYLKQGRYGKAESQLKEAKKLSEKILGKEHLDTICNISMLGNLYYLQGRYKEAEPLLKRSLEFRKNKLGENHPDTIQAMNSLAWLYNSMKYYKKAESILNKVQELSKTNSDNDKSQNIHAISSLARLYYEQNNLDKAEQFYKKSLELCQKKFGKMNAHTINSLNGLALVYTTQGRYEDADSLNNKIIQYIKRKAIKNHQNTITLIQNIILFHLKYAHVNKKYIQQITQAFTYLKLMDECIKLRSEQELLTTETELVRRNYLNSIQELYNISFSLAIKYPYLTEPVLFASNLLLRSKQIQADEIVFQQKILNTSKNPKIKHLKEKISKLSTQYTNAIQNNKKNKIKKSQQALIAVKKQLMEIARSLKPNLKAYKANVLNLLTNKPNSSKISAVVEFRFFDLIDFKTNNGEPHIAAYILRSKKLVENDIEQSPFTPKNQKLFFIDIGEEEPVRKLWNKWQQFETNNSPIDYVSQELYTLLFDKIEKYISDVDTLYIAPDNFLNIIPFSRLMKKTEKKKKYLAQMYKIIRLQTGRDLLNVKQKVVSNSLVAMGGIKYDNNTTFQISASVRNSNKNAFNQLKSFSYLKHSRAEAEAIVKLYQKYYANSKVASNQITKVYLGEDASEFSLKNLSSPKILHLSTHAFYLNHDKELQEQSPMTLSGIILANANMGLKGGITKHGEDGILYSLEASSLNMQGTELVSLSACSTGLGVIDSSEGIYGLVRAFRTAGAKSVLMTLRPVDDESSKAFMIQFYENYLSSNGELTPGEALHKTRLYFIDHPIKKYRDPKIWASYVMVGQ